MVSLSVSHGAATRRDAAQSRVVPAKVCVSILTESRVQRRRLWHCAAPRNYPALIGDFQI